MNIRAFILSLALLLSAGDLTTGKELNFCEVHPDVDTRPGIEVIGNQMLKMGDHRAAIALLEANARGNPDAPTSAFGLGRAYETAGEVEKARAEYQRALRLKPDYKRADDALQRLQW